MLPVAIEHRKYWESNSVEKYGYDNDNNDDNNWIMM